jgi:hypothetical protein
MKKRVGSNVLYVVSCLVFMLLVCHAIFFAQEKTDTAKLYAEIAGDYEFDMEGEVTVLTFFVRDGVLLGKAVGDSDEEEVTLEPVEGKEMGFTTTNSQGMFIELTFSRDENGKITKCLVNAVGMEIEGVRIKE